MSEERKKGCSPRVVAFACIGCAVLAVPCIAVLAAIGLPMYTRFKLKTEAIKPIKVAIQASDPLVASYTEYGSFENLVLKGKNLSVVNSDGSTLITQLVELEGVRWRLISGTNNMAIQWHSSRDACPTEMCSGSYCIQCEDGECWTAITMETPELGLNRNPSGIDCP